MIEYLISAVFLISAASASVAVLTSINLKRKYDNQLFTSLIFYQIFFYIFGFYGIWGQLIITNLVSPYFELEIFAKITNISLLSAYPFLILAWMMLLSVAFETANKYQKKQYYYVFLLLNFAILPLLGVLIYRFPEFDIFNLLKYIFFVFTVIYSCLFFGILLFGQKTTTLLSPKSMQTLALGVFIIMLLSAGSVLYVENIYAAMAFIIMYFLSGAFLPLYIRYRADFSPIILQSSIGLSFADFCSNFDITTREAEIIHEICNGYSNQEIADNLFISLTTVKGHTSRIYMKTNLRSRAQLITIVGGLK